MKKSTESASGLAAECQEAGILAATFSAPHPGGPAAFTKIRVRPVRLKAGAFYQLEQFGGAKATHRNVPAGEIAALIAEWLGASYGRAEISTPAATIQVIARPGAALKVLRKAAVAAAVPLAHDRGRKSILPEGSPLPFLVGLGVMAKDGSVIPAMQARFRQINRFLELLAGLVPELRRAALEPGRGPVPRELAIVDAGCGTAQLSFAAYYYLEYLQLLRVKLVAFDSRPGSAARHADLAHACQFNGLRFQEGTIADYKGAPADLVLSLHGDDAACDQALARAVGWNSRVILAAARRHPVLDARLAAGLPADSAPGRRGLEPALRHRLIREGLAALLDDALRAETLESRGWQVQVQEAPDADGTGPARLLRAVRLDPPPAATADAGPDASAAVPALGAFLGLTGGLAAALAAAPD